MMAQRAEDDIALRQAAAALAANRPGVAERHLRPYLARHPDDPAALRMLADVAARRGLLEPAEALLRRALAVAPSFQGARRELAILLHKEDRLDEALAAVEELLERGAADDEAALHLKATFLRRMGRFEEAIAISEGLLARFPDEPKLWLTHSHLLRALGRQDEAIATARRALALNPPSGDAWWSLADLKTVRFDDADLAAMEGALGNGSIGERDRTLIHFALGKAREDRGEAEAAFAHYRTANRVRRGALSYDPVKLTDFVAHSEAVLTTDFFASRAGFGDGAHDPIFIVGMHRAGSTLVEQILASHPSVEGIAEMGQIRRIAGGLLPRGAPVEALPDLLSALDAERCAALGCEYLARTSAHRRSGRPFFIDKMPGNWRYVGLIHLILPNAKIVDVRRHPLDCCLSNYRQYFAQGQEHAYDLEELGLFYRDYVRLMRHFDAALPGRVHRLTYERLVDDTEAEVRRLLEYLGLPFDPACLRFFETGRPVRTPSAQQVRQPINRRGIDQWRLFEPWLDPLKQALGPVLSAYPDLPPA